MSYKQYNDRALKVLRGLRPNINEEELAQALNKVTKPVLPPQMRKKVVPVYGLPVLCHCPRRGEFWQPKIIGHEIVNMEDLAGYGDARRDVDIEMDKSKTVPLSEEDVCFYKKNDAYRKTLDRQDTGILKAELADNLKRYEDRAYKVLRGIRRLDAELVKAYKTLCTESPAPRPPPRVRVVPTYGQPVLVHCARYGTFRQWKIVSHELVKPGQTVEEVIPEDIDDFVEIDEQIFPSDDEAYRHYKKHDTYELPATVDNTENADATTTASQVASSAEVPLPHPQVVDDDDDMDGLFGVYAREH